MLFAAVLLYVVILFLLIGIPLCKKMSYSAICLIVILWTTCNSVWYLYSPVFGGTPRILKSIDRVFDADGVVRNWGDTDVCTPSVIRAHNKNDVILALQSEHVRMVGSSHSWSGLICSNNTVLSLDFCTMTLTGTILHASAGCTISSMQTFLGKRGRMLHGFGSIMGQTFAGASMTSLHGVQFDMFTNNIIEMTGILANQTERIINGEELKFWRSSMGLLGVVVDMKIQTFPFSSIRRTTILKNFDDAMGYLEQPLDGLAITGLKDTFAVETFSEIQPANYSTLPHHNKWFLFGYDNIVQPSLMLLGGFSLFEGILHQIDIVRLTTAVGDVRLDMLHAWSHIVGFSSGSGSEYSVPLVHCKVALQEIKALDRLAYLYIRKVHNTTDILSFATEKSCCIEPYLIYSSNYQEKYMKFMTDVEKIVLKYNGKTHWGKKFHLAYGNMIPNEFKDYRARLDPTGKFMSTFTHQMFNGEKVEYKPLVFATRGMIWMLLFWSTLLSLPWVLLFDVPIVSFRRGAQIALSFWTMLLAWIVLNIHDTQFKNGKIHGDHHYKIFALTTLWLFLAIVYFIMTILQKSYIRLRIITSIIIVIDGMTKVNQLDHALSTIVLGCMMLVSTLCLFEHNEHLPICPLRPVDKLKCTMNVIFGCKKHAEYTLVELSEPSTMTQNRPSEHIKIQSNQPIIF